MHDLPIVVQSLRSKAEAGDKAAALELAEDDELFKQHMQPEEVQRENRAKIRRVDPTVNLAADGFDRWSESMSARDSSKVGASMFFEHSCTDASGVDGPGSAACMCRTA